MSESVAAIQAPKPANRRRNRKLLSRVDQEFLNVLRERFPKSAGDGRRIDLDDLKRLLGIRDAYLAQRLFSVLGGNGDGRIAEGQMFTAAVSLILAEEEEKLRFVFRLHDADGDGVISPEELDRMIAACLSENRLTIAAEDQRAIRDELLREAAEAGLEFHGFLDLLSHVPLIRRQLVQSVANWFGAGEHRGFDVRHSRLRTVIGHALHSVPSVVWWVFLVAVYAAANAYLFRQAFLHYAESGANLYIQIARGSGACLNLNGMLILVPMMRTLLTRLRRSFLGSVLPLDESIGIHQTLGGVMLVLALVHSVAHLLNYAGLALPFTVSLFGTTPGLTGIILLGVFLVMGVFALPPIRRSRLYEVFAFTHVLYWAWFALAVVHAPRFILWAAVPVAGFLAEQMIRRLAKQQLSLVKQGTSYATGVTHLRLYRPDGFEFRPAEYLYLRIPKLSRFGWHPFTISSGPEERGYIGLHVRALGNWTRRLHQLFATLPPDRQQLPVEFHGPYGTPSTRIFSSRHAVLIGGGIGVTPFASILRSIAERFTSGRDMCLEKVHFFWLYNGQSTFEWFSELLEDLERRGLEDLLETHIYLTDARINATTGLLRIGLERLHSATRRDLLTGLHARTNFGRPDWDQIFSRISAGPSLGRVDVFFCGPHPLGRAVRVAARRAGFRFRTERF